jgi:hypothetical protein
VNKLLSGDEDDPDANDIVIFKFNIEMTKKDVRKLKPGVWYRVNDNRNNHDL